MAGPLPGIVFVVVISFLLSACESVYISDEALIPIDSTQYPDDLAKTYGVLDPSGDPSLPYRYFVNIVTASDDQKYMELYIPNRQRNENTSDKISMYAKRMYLAPLGDGWYLAQLNDLYGENWSSLPIKITGDSFIVPNINAIDDETERQFAQNFGISLVWDSTFRAKITQVSNADAVKEFFRAMTGKLRGETILAKAVPIDALPEGLANAGRRFAFENNRNFTVDGVRGAAVDETFMQYFNKLDEEGSAWAAFYLARIYANGWFVDVDYGKAEELATRAVGRGLEQANLVLGFLATYGLGGKKDQKVAFRYFLDAALAGEPQAQLFVGMAYNSGNGVQKDTDLGVTWLKKAAKQRNSDAYVDLGRFYAGKSQGNSEIATDDKEAFEWFKKAAAAKNPEGHGWLAWAYAGGTGVKQDQKEASRQYLLAAKLGDAWSQFQIGERLISGNGISVDKNAGRAWLEKAAEAGVKKAAESLARIAKLAKKQTPVTDTEDVPSKISKSNVNVVKNVQEMNKEILGLCVGRVCRQLRDGRYIIQSLDKTFWLYIYGRVAPREVWP